MDTATPKQNPQNQTGKGLSPSHLKNSFWENTKKRFRKNKSATFALRVVVFLAIVAILADFLAYNKPFYAKYKGEVYYPLFNDYLSSVGLYQWSPDLIHAEWREIDRQGELESAFWPPVRYMPSDLDYDNQRLLGPFDRQSVIHWKYHHFLGTDRDGRDVLSGLIHGTRISLTIGLVAVGIAAFIGILLGAFAGFFGDNRLQLSRIGIIFLVIGIFLGFFYGFQVRSYTLSESLAEGDIGLLFQIILSLAIMLGVILLSVLISKPLEFIPWLGKKRYLWIDIALSRFIELWTSIPTLLLIITISAITESQSLYLLMAMIGIFGWPGIARYMRGEILRTRSQLYIEAARSLGFSEFRVLFRHAIPNALAPVLVVMAFGVASAIILEATLSFLGIGVPDDIITWGKLLREASQDISAWWLIIFPGFTIFLTVTTLNLLGEGLRDALDPKVSDDS